MITPEPDASSQQNVYEQAAAKAEIAREIARKKYNDESVKYCNDIVAPKLHKLYMKLAINPYPNDRIWIWKYPFPWPGSMYDDIIRCRQHLNIRVLDIGTNGIHITYPSSGYRF